MQYHQFRAMNTVVVLGVESEYPFTAFQLAQEFIEHSERRFSRFLPDSELNTLNRSAGNWFSASPELMELLSAARECHLATQGLFNPAILPDLQAAGYTRTLPDLYLFGAGGKPENFSKHAAPPFTDVELDLAHHRIRLPVDMQIDLGGIAKGWVAQKAANLLAKFSTACVVNAGGDMFLIGHPNGQNWNVVLEDPLNHSHDLLMLLVERFCPSSRTSRNLCQSLINRRTARRPSPAGRKSAHLIYCCRYGTTHLEIADRKRKNI